MAWLAWPAPSLPSGMMNLMRIQVTKRIAAVACWSCILIALALTLADGSTVAFQERQLGEEQIEQIRARIQETRERLNLTDEQIEQVTPILRAGFEAQMEVLEQHGIDIGNRSGGRNRLRLRQLRQLGRDLDAARERTVEELGAVLSEEQIEVYKEIQEERRQAMRERLRGRR